MDVWRPGGFLLWDLRTAKQGVWAMLANRLVRGGGSGGNQCVAHETSRF